MLNLWCADGLRAARLADVQRVRFLNPALDSKFRKALEALAQSHDAQKKAVSLLFSGKGKRRVSVGYVVESPVWKTTYRLVLGKENDDKPYLQGWRVVENPSDEDWRDVRMALVSGRPISFRMDLYQPLYVPRPLVVPELFASLNPVAYSGNMEPTKPTAPEAAAPREAKARLEDLKEARSTLGVLRRGGQGKAGGAGTHAGEVREELARHMDLGASVATAAAAAQLGDFFQYVIDRPVTLPRQKSALLPIVGKDVEATRVSIYNEGTQPKFPLLGLRLKNTSGLHLLQGPVTVFEGSTYAGDARVADLQPNEERLLSYAVDLGTEVKPEVAANSGRLTQLKAVKGVLHSTTKLRETKTYTVRNRNPQGRTVLIEHPVRPEFKLVSKDRPAETARDVYRFELKVPAGKTAKETVTEERDLTSTALLTNSPDEQVRIFLQSPVVGDKVKKGLKRAQGLRREWARAQREIGERQRQLQAVAGDQGRLRADLRGVPQTSPLHKYGLTVCVERVAGWKAVSEGYRAFTRVAVVAGTGGPTTPCGACRQTLWELGGDLEMTLANPEAPEALYRARGLPPHPFDARLPGG